MRDAVSTVADLAARLVAGIESVIVGKRGEVEAVVCCLLAGGHVLIEDLPGTGKTMLARSLAAVSGGDFRRIQATPDLLPNDVTGFNVYDPGTGAFDFRPGPVFANVVLADEINRATPRTQSALLEAMAERQVTVEGETRALPDPFMVVATQNPIEFEGTFPLPEAQLDRFLVSVSIGYPGPDDEADLVRRLSESHPIESVSTVAEPAEITRARAVTAAVEVGREIADLIVAIAAATRSHPSITLPASPRASLALAAMSRAAAALDGRDFVAPDDVKRFAGAVLSHRLGVTADARLRGATPEAIVEEILSGRSMGVRDIEA